MTWTDESVATLTRLWGEGQSSGDIAKAIGATRYAVCSKVDRLKLPKRSKPARPVKVRVKSRGIGEQRCEPGSVKLVDLQPNDCRYPTLFVGLAVLYWATRPKRKARPEVEGNTPASSKGNAQRIEPPIEGDRIKITPEIRSRAVAVQETDE